jgi:hypothetical protein
MDYEIRAAAKKLEAEQKARLEKARKKLDQERREKEDAKRRQVRICSFFAAICGVRLRVYLTFIYMGLVHGNICLVGSTWP